MSNYNKIMGYIKCALLKNFHYSDESLLNHTFDTLSEYYLNLHL